MPPLALLIRSPGTNNERETRHAFELAGARVKVQPFEALERDASVLKEAQIVMFPGGFAYGDDLGAGRVTAIRMKSRLMDALRAHLDRGGLVMGHCNGFQILVQSGLLPGVPGPLGAPAATLALNLSGRFECRWVPLHVLNPGIFFRGLGSLWLPVAHAEGRFLTASPEVLGVLRAKGQIALVYRRPDGGIPSYPDDPNGAEAQIAGITDPSGRILGMMPHPERFVRREQHPLWHRDREGMPSEGLGLHIYRNAVEYLG